MLSALSGSVAFAPTTGVRAPTVTTASVRMETKADLEVLAKKLNPTVGFYDPLGLADAVVDGSNEAADRRRRIGGGDRQWPADSGQRTAAERTAAE